MKGIYLRVALLDKVDGSFEPRCTNFLMSSGRDQRVRDFDDSDESSRPSSRP